MLHLLGGTIPRGLDLGDMVCCFRFGLSYPSAILLWHMFFDTAPGLVDCAAAEILDRVLVADVLVGLAVTLHEKVKLMEAADIRLAHTSTMFRARIGLFRGECCFMAGRREPSYVASA